LKSLIDQDHYEILEIDRDAQAAEIERAYQLMRTAFADGSLGLYSIYDFEGAEALRERVEFAYSVLSDAEERKAYDAELTFEDRRERAPALLLSLATEPVAEEAALEELEEFGGEDSGDFGGAHLRRVRLRRGLELEQIASTTKVSAAYLRFIEEESFDDLPAAVYVRGFVSAYARSIGLDAPAAAASYMERFEARHKERRRPRILGRR